MSSTPLQSPDVNYNYEIIPRIATFILVIYEDDMVLGSLAFMSEEKLEEWIKKLELIEVKKRIE